jgi:hypothetical protein
MTDRTKKKTLPQAEKFDTASPPEDLILNDRRAGQDRRSRADGSPSAKSTNPGRIPAERPAKKERRRRIDPTTFEKQYTDDEIEFMNAMQYFKMQSGRSFPTYGEVLKVANDLGYRKMLALKLIQGIDESAPLSEGSSESSPKIT